MVLEVELSWAVQSHVCDRRRGQRGRHAALQRLGRRGLRTWSRAACCSQRIWQTLAICTHEVTGSPNGPLALDDARKKELGELCTRLASDGLRVLCVARKEVPFSEVRSASQPFAHSTSCCSLQDAASYKTSLEAGLAVVGFIAFLDPPKPDAGTCCLVGS